MKFFIYSKPNCSFCVRAKALLKNKGLDFYEQVLGEDYSKEDLFSWFPDAKTLPQIEVQFTEKDAKYIGGYDDLVKYLEKQNDCTSES